MTGPSMAAFFPLAPSAFKRRRCLLWPALSKCKHATCSSHVSAFLRQLPLHTHFYISHLITFLHLHIVIHLLVHHSSSPSKTWQCARSAPLCHFQSTAPPIQRRVEGQAGFYCLHTLHTIYDCFEPSSSQRDLRDWTFPLPRPYHFAAFSPTSRPTSITQGSSVQPFLPATPRF